MSWSKQPAAVALPRPLTSGGPSLREALGQRRSVRDFADRPIDLGDAAQLLWAAQGITDREGKRTAPSGGALYPLEVYLVAGRVQGLADGVYRYRPRGHDLQPVAEGDRRVALARAALDQQWVGQAAAVVVIAAVYARITGKYGERGQRYAKIEAGHAAQNLCLTVAARGLGTTVVGAFDDAKVGQVLGSPADHRPLLLLPVGHRR